MRDLSGKRFGRQVALHPTGVNKYRNVLWMCRCDCGNEHIVSGGKLVQGKSRSCGCLARDTHVKQLERHGITTGGKPRTFIIWNGMKARCNNSKSTSYKNYGARGIRVCNEWLSFEAFHTWAINNGYRDDFEIDRIDNDGNYCPENCRWISKRENRRRMSRTHFIEICGIAKPVSEWCKILHISKATAYQHLHISDSDFADYCRGQQYFVNKILGK